MILYLRLSALISQPALSQRSSPISCPGEYTLSLNQTAKQRLYQQRESSPVLILIPEKQRLSRISLAAQDQSQSKSPEQTHFLQAQTASPQLYSALISRQAQPLVSLIWTPGDQSESDWIQQEKALSLLSQIHSYELIF